MRILLAGLLPFLLVSCGTSAGSGAGADALQAGKWTLSTTLGTPQGIVPGREPPLVIEQCVGAAQADLPVRDAILALASRGACNADDARFERGTIGGALRCSGMDDIPEHREGISGSYGPNSFHMIVDMTTYGAVVRQTIDARRTGECMP